MAPRKPVGQRIVGNRLNACHKGFSRAGDPPVPACIISSILGPNFMANDNSVTEWLAQLKAGDRNATPLLWERYFERLVRLALGKLGGEARRTPDAEDVAVSIFAAAVKGIEKGRFRQLDDRNDLWQIVLMLADRKVNDLKRYEGAAKRDRGRVLNEPASAIEVESGSEPGGLSQIESREARPDEIVALRDQLDYLISRLPDDALRAVACENLAGYPPCEIAERLGMSLRSVARKLSIIRSLWMRKDTE